MRDSFRSIFPHLDGPTQYVDLDDASANNVDTYANITTNKPQENLTRMIIVGAGGLLFVVRLM
jgi:hypothetical protein